MFALENRVVLVTGATGGLGESIARNMHQQGAYVVVSGRREEVLKGLTQQLKERIQYVPCDLNCMEDVESLLEEAHQKVGHPIDTLVNNAGMTADTLLMRMKDEQWETVLRVNLESAFRLTRAAVKIMMKARFGRVINITSIVGITGNPGQSNYAASKAGLIGFTKSVAAEVASRGITINCVAPGFIKTPMTDALNEKQKEALLQNIPARMMGEAQDIAAAVIYLASQEARYVTGHTLHVNGGMAMI